MSIGNASSSDKMTSVWQMLASLVFVMVASQAAAIHNLDSRAGESSGNRLISSIVNDCLTTNVMDCVNQKVLNFLDAYSNAPLEESRAAGNVEEIILRRVGRILASNEIKVEIPNSLFPGMSLVYRPDLGLDLHIPKEEGRGVLLKKKLFLPLLLLLKLKMKALMPILVALIGLKAMKALILSKIAIKIVLGFVIYQLFQKLSAAKMSMMPMTPMTPTETPMGAYGTPAATPPSSTYESGWEQSSGPYARVWDSPQHYSSQNLAYRSYDPKAAGVLSSNSISSSSSSTLSASEQSF